MKAIRVHEYGGPEVLRYEDVPLPEPGAGEVRVKLAAVGVNFIDVYQRTGQYKMALPSTIGSEGAGVVDALGPDVSDLNVGDRVAFPQGLGAYAEYIVVPAAKLVPVPPDIDLQVAAAVLLQGMTAHYLVSSTFPITPGQRVLIHAAAGGVGLLLVQLAKQRGALVIGTVSTEEKAQLAREAGVDYIIRYTEQNFVSETRRLTDGAGVDVVYDSVGKTTFEGSLDCLRPRGYLVLFGQSSGAVPPFDPQVLNAKGSLFLTRPTLGHHIATRDELMWRAHDLFTAISAGTLKVRIDRAVPLADVAAAQNALVGRETSGKVLLLP
ncbi:MAG: quinone oxidoreductase [Chloroflexota bacterium]|nr:quinone oxidoreductase [Chloroflexota bacterium]PLS80718.1 MAG: NADPH:quinone reductase [Chloroflexota bacterium]